MPMIGPARVSRVCLLLVALQGSSSPGPLHPFGALGQDVLWVPTEAAVSTFARAALAVPADRSAIARCRELIKGAHNEATVLAEALRASVMKLSVIARNRGETGIRVGADQHLVVVADIDDARCFATPLAVGSGTGNELVLEHALIIDMYSEIVARLLATLRDTLD